jgi:hypothetical protein
MVLKKIATHHCLPVHMEGRRVAKFEIYEAFNLIGVV